MGFARFGFFHFGTGHDQPFDALEKALCDVDTDKSLVVLPEALNWGRPYWEGRYAHNSAYSTPAFSLGDSIRRLRKIASRRRITFVTGLIDDERKNNAFLVNGREQTLMCQKLSDDRTGNYDPVADNNGCRNPIDHEEACLAALICDDARGGSPAREYRDAVAEGMKRSKVPLKIVCVPAHMTVSFEETIPSQALWRDKRVVLANSYASIPSFITDMGGQVVARGIGEKNEVRLEAVSSGDVP